MRDAGCPITEGALMITLPDWSRTMLCMLLASLGLCIPNANDVNRACQEILHGNAPPLDIKRIMLFAGIRGQSFGQVQHTSPEKRGERFALEFDGLVLVLGRQA